MPLRGLWTFILTAFSTWNATSGIIGMTKADPLVWGFWGSIFGAVLVPIMLVTGQSMASPVAGGFFTGWLAAHLWNWSGQRR